MDRVPLLVATKGPLKGKQYSVTESGLMVGRDETCDVTIPDAGVSRQHARVLLHNAAVWVQDEGSRNGVFVNGKRVVRHRQLSPGAEMLIGEHAFTLELVSGPPASTTASTTPQEQLAREPTQILTDPQPPAQAAGFRAAGFRGFLDERRALVFGVVTATAAILVFIIWLMITNSS